MPAPGPPGRRLQCAALLAGVPAAAACEDTGFPVAAGAVLVVAVVLQCAMLALCAWLRWGAKAKAQASQAQNTPIDQPLKHPEQSAAGKDHRPTSLSVDPPRPVLQRVTSWGGSSFCSAPPDVGMSMPLLSSGAVDINMSIDGTPSSPTPGIPRPMNDLRPVNDLNDGMPLSTTPPRRARRASSGIPNVVPMVPRVHTVSPPVRPLSPAVSPVPPANPARPPVRKQRLAFDTVRREDVSRGMLDDDLPSAVGLDDKKPRSEEA
eukprot:TRINITY_DN16976_c0_g1_i1.p1 TRINITY_DN16976_c0_g1~~TRINITY_DN16976_c0_g1_i1.p1  ORF type:complete len:263 (+),score=27.25 TRINITY_DN16976_c0_g1_i1:58-846(+)